ncbi:hypothetical protein ACWCPI_37475 [Streptomyces sp. NPDC001920]
MTKYLAVLQFTANGPKVTGEWTPDTTALRTWRDRVGLYGADEQVIIRVIEETDGRERVLTAWEHGQVVEAP